jgi:hypothetical protein
MRVTWPRLLVLQLTGAAVTVGWGLILRSMREPNDIAATAAQVAGAMVNVMVLALATLAAVHLVILTAAGQHPTVAACLRGGLRRLMPLIAWSIPAAALISVGLVLLVVPGLYFFAVLVLLVPVVAVERRVGIGRCFDIFRGHWRPAIARTGTILGLTLVLTTIGTSLFSSTGGILQADPGAATSVAVLIIDSLLAAITGVATIPLIVTAYADLRARTEPISTGQLAAQLSR